jgi:hypothetical protein
MPVFAQPPVIPAETCELRTHELQIGSEIVERDGTTVTVIERGADGPRIFIRLTDGSSGDVRRGRTWRVIAPAT